MLRHGADSADELTAVDLLDRGADRIRTDLADQDLVRARLMDTIGDVYRSMALFDRAGPLLRDALAIRERALGPDDPETADSLLHLAFYHHNRAEFDEAEPLYRRALAIREANAEGDHDPEVALVLLQLAWMLADQGYPEAEDPFRRAIAIHEGAARPRSRAGDRPSSATPASCSTRAARPRPSR